MKDTVYGKQYDIFDYLIENDIKEEQTETISTPTELYTYHESKKEDVIPEEYIHTVIMKGSGFANGKFRIDDIVKSYDKKEAIQMIKKEYGIGGAGWPLDGYGLHGYNTLGNKGITLEWRDAEGEKYGVLKWTEVYKEIKKLVDCNEYITRVEIAESFLHEAMGVLYKQYGVNADISTHPYYKECKELVKYAQNLEASA